MAATMKADGNPSRALSPAGIGRVRESLPVLLVVVVL